MVYLEELKVKRAPAEKLKEPMLEKEWLAGLKVKSVTIELVLKIVD